MIAAYHLKVPSPHWSLCNLYMNQRYKHADDDDEYLWLHYQKIRLFFLSLLSFACIALLIFSHCTSPLPGRFEIEYGGSRVNICCLRVYQNISPSCSLRRRLDGWSTSGIEPVLTWAPKPSIVEYIDARWSEKGAVVSRLGLLLFFLY